MKIRQICIAGLLFISATAPTSRLAAQILPDSTLPSNSIVIPNEGNLLLIEGGTAAGGNLFHSFEGFSVPANSTAFFSNSPEIQNIFSRVTGSSVSNIDGILGANGLVNLFFLNPNGIIFGPTAQLQIGGSFLATTANSIEFDNGSFSATNPQAPPLLVINIPTSLEFGSAPGSIVNRSQAAPEGLPPNSIGNPLGLAVPPGRTLALVGGDVTLENGNISAFGGRIELGSVAGSGSVSFSPTEMGFALDYEGVDNFGNIGLSQNSVVDASGFPTEAGGRGGEIQVRGDRLTVENSGITSSTFNSLESSPGGNLTVTASEIEIRGTVVRNILFPSMGSIESAGLFNQSQGSGQGGNLTIETERLTVQDGAQVSTATSSQGQGGSLTVTASDFIELSGVSPDANDISSGLSSTTQGTGNAGNLTIITSVLTVRDGAQVSTVTSGQGQGGSLTITASDSIELTGISTSGILSGLSSEAVGAGSAGELKLSTSQLIVRDGAQVSAATSGEGQGGSLTVTASDSIELIGTASIATPDGRQLPSGLGTETTGSGNAGSLTISTNRLTIRDGAEVSTTAFGLGNAGNLSIQASGSVRISDAGAISSATANSTGGNANIETGQLIVETGGQILATTIGSGSGGNLTVNATESVELSGTRPDRPSALSTQSQGSQVQSDAGDAGNLTLSTRRLTVRDGAAISGDTFADGLGGSVTINASESIQVRGRSASPPARTLRSVDDDGLLPSRLSVFSQGTGNAGSLNIETERLTVEDRAQIAVDARQGIASAGNLDIEAPEISLDAGILTAETASGGQGNITLNTDDLQLRDVSQINTNAGSSQGGNININTRTLAAIQNSDITANAQAGPGGRVIVNAQGIFGTEFQENLTNLSDITATSELGPQFNGVVDINTPDIDPSRGLVELEEEVVNVASQINQNPCRVASKGSFVDTGRGGLPPNPTGLMNYQQGWEDWEDFDEMNSSGWGADEIDSGSGLVPDETDGADWELEQTPVVQASGWELDGEGNLLLKGSGGITGFEKDSSSCSPGGMKNLGTGGVLPGTGAGTAIAGAGTAIAGAGTAIALPLQGRVGSRVLPGTGAGTAIALPLQGRVGSGQGRVGSGGNSGPETFVFEDFEVTGSTVFGREKLAEITEEFADKPLTFEELLEVGAAISELYKEEGYIGSGAVIPPQTVPNGIAMVRVVENTLETDIDVTTEGRLTPNYVKGRLGVKAGDVVNEDQLLEALQLLQLDPLIKKVVAELSTGVQPNTTFLTVRVEEAPLFGAGLAIDNGRSPSVGSFRRTGQLQANSLLGLGDVASVAYTNTDGSDTWEAGYIIPINASNGTLGFRYSSGASDIIEPPFDRADIEANSRSYDLTYRQPLIESIQKIENQNGDNGETGQNGDKGDNGNNGQNGNNGETGHNKGTQETEFITTRFAVGLSASRQESETSLLGFPTPLSPGANDQGETRISALRFFQEWTRQENRQIFAARSQFSLGVGWFNATVNNNEADSRFFSWRGQGQWVRKLRNKEVSPLLLVEADLQLSPSALVPLEQISLGGQNSVRGYRQDARLADNGAFTSVELRYPIVPSPRLGVLHVIPFLDAGVAWNSDGNSNPSPNTLVGTGLGLQFTLNSGLRARLDWGIPLVDVDSRDRTWQENGLYFSIESGLF